MKLQELQPATEAALTHLQELLHVGDWDLELEYGPCRNEGACAECTLDPAYQRATVRIDPDGIDGLEDLHRKLLHVVLGEMGLLDDVARSALEPLGQAAVETYNAASAYICERTVRAVELLLTRGLQIGASDLATGQPRRGP